MRRANYIAAIVLLLFPLPSLWAAELTLTDPNTPLEVLLEGGRLYHAPHPPTATPESPARLLNTLQPAAQIDRVRGGSYWLHAKLYNSSDNKHWVFDPFNAVMDTLKVYLYTADSVHQIDTGYLQKHQYSLHYGVDVELPPQQSAELLVYIDSRYFSGDPRFQISSDNQYAQKLARENAWIISCLGAVVALALYNLFIAAWMRDRSYLYYSAYLVMTVVAWAAAFNALGEWFGLYSYWLLIPPFFLTISFNILYFIHFLELPKHNPRLCFLAYTLAAWAGVMTFALPLFSPGDYMVIQALTSTTWITLGFTCGVLRLHSGYKPARFFVAAFGLLVVGVVMSILPVLGIKPLVENNYLATLVAQTVDILLLSLALADRINLLRREKENALQQAFASEQQKNLTEQRAKVTLEDANSTLQEALALSEKESERKSNFLRMVSHELRTPLHSISSSIHQWGDAMAQEEQKELLGDINYGASRLCTQIDNLVLVAETDDDNLEAESYPFQLAPMIEKLVKGARDRLANTEVKLVVKQSPYLPHGFYGDAYLISHLIRTTLDNACKFTERGEIRLDVDWNSPSQSLNITVSDDGCGMSKEQQQVVFEGFAQVSRGLTRQSEGLGLGLTLCHRLSHILEATLSIESQPGQGTDIGFQIPLQSLPERELALTDNEFKGSILIVEDNLVNAKVLERIVTKLGYPVDVAHSGLEALTAVSKKLYSVILMDIQMPDMDGITATQKIRHRGIVSPVIAVTANSDSQVRRECRLAGMNDFLVKPVSPSQVRQSLLEWQMVSPDVVGCHTLH